MNNLKTKIIDIFGTAIMAIMMYLDDIFDIIKTVLITYVVCYICTKFVFLPACVDGNSMYPTLKDKQLGVSNIIELKLGTIERNDIVVVKVDDELWVKRVIGLPNEIVECKNGEIYIDNQKIQQDYLNPEYVESELEALNKKYFTNDFYIELKDDEYFLVGDNRNHSYDSRFVGPFNKQDLVSLGFFVIYPFSEFGIKK